MDTAGEAVTVNQDILAQGAETFLSAVWRGLGIFFSWLITPAFVALLVMIFLMTFGSIRLCIRARVARGRLYSVCTCAALFSIWLIRIITASFPELF